MTSYAVVWREESGPQYVGKLELGPDVLRVQGSSSQGFVGVRTIAYADLVGVRIGRTPDEQVNGQRSVVLDRSAGRPISIAAVSGVGVVHEVAHALAELAAEDRERRSRIVIVMPLEPGAAERAIELVRAGPPFDPEALGVERHHVFVTEREAVFLFECADARAAMRRLAQRPRVLEAAAEWAALLAGPPLVADEAYVWIRSPFAGQSASRPPTSSSDKGARTPEDRSVGPRSGSSADRENRSFSSASWGLS